MKTCHILRAHTQARRARYPESVSVGRFEHVHCVQRLQEGNNNGRTTPPAYCVERATGMLCIMYVRFTCPPYNVVRESITRTSYNKPNEVMRGTTANDSGA